MTRRIVHQLVDDLDGSVIDEGSGETVLFSLDGVAYEIDLTNEHAAQLRDALSSYTDAARRVTSGRSGGGGSAGGASQARRRRRPGQQDYGAVREWAKENGYAVSERGRVPASILEAYEAAH